MRALFDQAIRNELVDFVSDEGPAQTQPVGELIYPHRFVRFRMRDGDQHKVLGRRQVDKTRELYAGSLKAAAKREIIIKEATKRPVSVVCAENLVRIDLVTESAACLLMADSVAKVENRTTPKISRKLIFRLPCRCNAL